MQRDLDLLVVGDVNPDLLLQGDDLQPRFGQAELLVERATLTVGGSAAITACGAARLGLRTAIVGAVGDDLYGRFMLEELARRGVDTGACVVAEGSGTGLSVVLTQSDDRAILTYPGAIPQLRYQQVDQNYLARARHLHVSSYFLLDALRPELPRLFAAAKSAGTGTSLDTNWDPRGDWGLKSENAVENLLESVDVLLPNEAEALALTGARTLDEALDGLGRHVPTVIVKLGERGATAAFEGRRHSSPALAVQVGEGHGDATGAGDSFAGGFLFGHLNGWELADSLRLACACGSLSTREVGGTTAQPNLEEALSAARLTT